MLLQPIACMLSDLFYCFKAFKCGLFYNEYRGLIFEAFSRFSLYFVNLVENIWDQYRVVNTNAN